MNNYTANFIFELGMLKKESHSGYKLAGLPNPYSIADHVCRAAQIGYILAIMEDVDPEQVACMVLFHDNPETRTRDLHRIAARYFPRDVRKQAERNAFMEQIAGLGSKVKQRLMEYFNTDKKSKEYQIAKEADELEQAATAKELLDQGHASAQNWLDNARLVIRSKSGKALLDEIENTHFTDWWKGLKDLTPYYADGADNVMPIRKTG